MNIEFEILDIVLRAIMISGGATLLAILWGIPLGILIGLKKFPFKSSFSKFSI